MPNPDDRARWPWVLMDIDGTLNCMRLREPYQAVPYTGPMEDTEGGVVHLNPAHGHLLRAIMTLGELTFVTAWPEGAVKWLADWYGLPEGYTYLWGTQYASHTFAGWTAKGLKIKEFVGDVRPVLWVDDTWGGKEHDWAEDRVAPTRLIEVAPPGYGLTDENELEILDWLMAQHV